MAKFIVLKNQSGLVTRTFPVDGQESLLIVSELESGRVKVIEREEFDSEIHNQIKEVNWTDFIKGPIEVGSNLKLEAADSVDEIIMNPVTPRKSERYWGTLLAGAMVHIVAVFGMLNMPVDQKKEEEEIKKHIVKIVKRKPPKRVEIRRSNVVLDNRVTKNVVKPTKRSVKRMGVLAALGSLKKGSKGGLNLGAVKTTRGPGLGGTAGSGGVQSRIYAKGIIAAPVGPGNNVRGGGGYGTKGKGGGQAGYGTMSLVGSSGASLIPVGEDASVTGGLDSALIADIVRKNIGQVRYCYEQGLQLDPSLKGRISVEWVIDSRGLVKTAKVNKTTLHSKVVESCIVQRLRTWKFPVPKGMGDTKVSYPFFLKRTGQG